MAYDTLTVMGRTEPNSTTTLTFEPLVLHVLYSSLPFAITLEALSHSLGFRSSGITIPASGKRPAVAVVVIRADLRLDMPVAVGGRWMVEGEYGRAVEGWVKEKFTGNQGLIDKLYKGIVVLWERLRCGRAWTRVVTRVALAINIWYPWNGALIRNTGRVWHYND